MHVLIVGCGYVGLPLGIELVRLGHDVSGLRRSLAAETELKRAGIRPLHADITLPETLTALPRDFDWVVNCTASGGGDADNYRKIYLEGNRNLLAWLAAMPPKKFVYTSSTSVYAQNDGSVVTEASPAQPEASTSHILVETENFLLSEAQKHFPAIILRVAGIYGPARGHAFKQYLRGEARIEGEGARWLNMIHRDDVIGAIIAALGHGMPGEIYNAADDEPVTQLRFFEWLAAKLEKPLPPRVAGDAEVWRKRGVTNKRVSNAKLRAELKYEFKFPDFRAGYAAEIAQMDADHS
ncbi:MAG TPA: SDR family oxidoreductase [Verrucomicrobiae bacterium]|nr:SDR family oxidoreductase [Verrucomicrobiae bacterium]